MTVRRKQEKYPERNAVRFGPCGYSLEFQIVTLLSGEEQNLFPKITNRILTFFTVATETAVAHTGKLLAADGLTG